MSPRGDGYLFQPRYKDKRTGKMKKAAVWWLEIWSGGKRHRICTGLRSKEDARRYRTKKLSDLMSGKIGALHSDRVTLDELLRLVENDYVARGLKSAKQLGKRLGRLRKFFGEGAMAYAVTTDRVTEYAASRRREGAAPGTINLELALLGRGFSLAVRASKLGAAPVIDKLRDTGVRKGFFEAEEWERIRAALEPAFVPVCDFYWFTGWRRTEALELRWSNIDWKAETIRLEPGTTKNREARTFPFGEYAPLRDLLKAQLAAVGSSSPYVFPHPTGKLMPHRTLDEAWRRACRRVGSDRLVHDFRRTAARRMEQAGVPRSVAMKLLGWRTESVYRRYAITATADLEAGVKKLQAVVQAPEPTDPSAATGQKILPFWKRRA